MALPDFSQLFLDVPTRFRRLLGSTLQQSTQRLETVNWIIQIIHTDETFQIQLQSHIPDLSTSFPGCDLWTFGKTQWKFLGLRHTGGLIAGHYGARHSFKCKWTKHVRAMWKKRKKKIWASLPVIQSLFCVKGFYLLPSTGTNKNYSH